MVLGCPEGMVLVPAARSSAGKLLSPFCIDIFEYPNIPGEMPVYNISWIEAQSLCAKQGKRLCKVWEWQTACAGPQKLAYPYANSYHPDACNTEQEWMMNASKVFPAGTFSACISGYGAYDMSGNVAEWTASSEKTAKVLGGSWVSGRFSSCKSFYVLEKTTSYQFNGVRCCKDATPVGH